MSHTRIKTTYQEDDGCGGEETHTLFAHINHSCDITLFYDDHGTYLFSVHSVKNSMLDAINRLNAPYDNLDDARHGKFSKGIEWMNVEEMKKCGI
ncbi:MAG: hypothetical protein HQK96_03860 [Nitrospirae bacterium]|nr:hypothetical protein [Nitrospirota bacterium]